MDRYSTLTTLGHDTGQRYNRQRKGRVCVRWTVCLIAFGNAMVLMFGYEQLLCIGTKKWIPLPRALASSLFTTTSRKISAAQSCQSKMFDVYKAG